MDDYEKSLQRAKKLLAECGAENLADIILQAHSDRDRLTDIALVVAKHSLPPDQYNELHKLLIETIE